METFLACAKGPVASIIGSLAARALTLRLKSHLSRGEVIVRPARATIGVIVSESQLTLVLKTLLYAIVSNLDVEKLTVIWLNSTRPLDTVQFDRVSVCSDMPDVKVDMILDVDSSFSWGSVAEIQTTMSNWLKRTDPGAPIVVCGLRGERVCAHTEDPGPFATVKARAQNVNVGLESLDWSIELPSITGASWSRGMLPLSQIVTRAQMTGRGIQSTVNMIPFRVVETVAAQSKLGVCFSQAIDDTVVRMGSRGGEIPFETRQKAGSRAAVGSDLLDTWARSLPLLGILRLSVMVFDPLDECRGIYSAALDGWRHGNSVWPV